MCLSTQRLDAIKRELYADLERGLAHINKTLTIIAEHVPEDWHIHFGVQTSHIVIEGEGKYDENMAVLLKLAHIFDRKPDILYIGDGWDGMVLGPVPDSCCIWVTNVANPDGPRPRLS